MQHSYEDLSLDLMHQSECSVSTITIIFKQFKVENLNIITYWLFYKTVNILS